MTKDDIIYISVDTEYNGSVPGTHSMLQIGAAAFSHNTAELVSTYSSNIEPLPGATQDPTTMAWWGTQPQAWARVQNGRPAEVVTREFDAWVRQYPKRVFVAYPLPIDFAYVHYYTMTFCGDNPFTHVGLDIKTLAWAALGQDFDSIKRGRFPNDWAPPNMQEHDALSDAIYQGRLAMSILTELRLRP